MRDDELQSNQTDFLTNNFEYGIEQENRKSSMKRQKNLNS